MMYVVSLSYRSRSHTRLALGPDVSYSSSRFYSQLQLRSSVRHGSGGTRTHACRDRRHNLRSKCSKQEETRPTEPTVSSVAVPQFEILSSHSITCAHTAIANSDSVSEE